MWFPQLTINIFQNIKQNRSYPFFVERYLHGENKYFLRLKELWIGLILKCLIFKNLINAGSFKNLKAATFKES